MKNAHCISLAVGVIIIYNNNNPINPIQYTEWEVTYHFSFCIYNTYWETI